MRKRKEIKKQVQVSKMLEQVDKLKLRKLNCIAKTFIVYVNKLRGNSSASADE
ncbi:hypothetical protein [Hathewaya massiliensis]|uniref:hypothetical protein n=1 Tax=Hathewaya massiliensis TaxID=1964382 RepID=UPI00163CB216|nr:hypothetical protein [Hathewaya massiliensis]